MRALHVLAHPVPWGPDMHNICKEGENFAFFEKLEDAYRIAGLSYCEITFEDGVDKDVQMYCLSRQRCTCH